MGRFSYLSSSSFLSSSQFLFRSLSPSSSLSSLCPQSLPSSLSLSLSPKSPLLSHHSLSSLSPLIPRFSSPLLSFPPSSQQLFFSTTQNEETYLFSKEKQEKEREREIERALSHREEKIGQPTPTTHPHLFPTPQEQNNNNKQNNNKQNNNNNNITPGIKREEYKERRERLGDVLPFGSVLLLSGNATSFMSNDIPFVFRQHSDLFYLSGCLEPSSVLVITKETNGETKTTLFLANKDPQRETWDGIMTGPERALSFFGVDHSLSLSSLSSFLSLSLLPNAKHIFVDMREGERLSQSENALFREVLDLLYRRSEVSVDRLFQLKMQEKVGGPFEEKKESILPKNALITIPFNHQGSYSSFSSSLSQIVTDSLQKMKEKEEPLPSIYPLSPLVQVMRLFKSPQEASVLNSAVRIASASFADAMRFTTTKRPTHASSPSPSPSPSSSSSSPTQKPFAITEHQLLSRMQYSSQFLGAKRLAYPPVVAGGPNALILHYVSCDEPLYERDIVLVDAGADLDGYCSDITRSWVIGSDGKFSLEQRDVYGVVLDALKVCVSECRGGVSLNHLHSFCATAVAAGLIRLGLVEGTVNEVLRSRSYFTYFPHSVSHYLGIDVHDTPLISKDIPLATGMIITIEPGVYVPLTDPSKYAGIGIRLEENVVITPDGCQVLSNTIPLEIEDVEATCASWSQTQ